MPESSFPTRSLKKGEILFREGEEASEAYLIRKGYVSIWRTEGSKCINLATKAEGEIIGEMALIDATTRSANVTAESDVVVEVIARTQLYAELENAPATITVILHQLLESLRCANDLIAMYASRQAAK